MPRTKNGDELNVGDVVTVEFKVIYVQKGEIGCNVSLQTVEPLDLYQTGVSVTLSSKMCVKQPKTDSLAND